MGSERPRLLLLIPHLGGGGAERVIELLASGLPRERFEIHLGVVCASPHNTRQLSDFIAVYFLGAARVRFSWWRILRLVWRVKPHLILSGMAHLSILILALRPFLPHGGKVLVRQNGALPSAKSRLATAVYRLLTSSADGIIAQSEAMAAEIRVRTAIHPAKVRALKNPVPFPALELRRGSGEKTPHLIAVGRLSHEKGFDLLLSAFATLLAQNTGLILTIVGEGPERVRIEEQVADLDLQNIVRLPGYVEKPFEAISAGIFVLSSRSEGMPNALLEAAAYGLPIVATPCSEGLCELLAAQPGVWLAGEVSAVGLEQAIAKALSNWQPCTRLVHEFVAPFELHAAIASYVEYFSEVLAR